MLTLAQHRLLKLRRAALWFFASLSLFTCVLWVVSLWGVNWDHPLGIGGRVAAWYGCLEANNYGSGGESDISFAGFTGGMRWWPYLPSSLLDIHFYSWSLILWSASIPFWLILVFFVLCFTAVNFTCRRTLHRLHNRLCMKCGYDLASLPRADHCPECAHPRTFRYPK